MKKYILKGIRFYQQHNLFQSFSFLPFFGACRFFPTCSEYTYEATAKYGTIKGLLLGLSRIFRCNPFTRGGYDPLK